MLPAVHPVAFGSLCFVDYSQELQIGAPTWWQSAGSYCRIARRGTCSSRPESAATPERERDAPVGPGWWALFVRAGSQWVDHKDARLGAALAYYSVFSIGPLIVIAIAVAGLIFGQDAVRGDVSGSLKGLLGDTGAQAIDAMLISASKPREGILATAIGIATLIFAAIGVVVQLKDALNTVWDVKTPPGRGCGVLSGRTCSPSPAFSP